MVGLVLDASVTLAAVLQEENSTAAADLIDRVADERAVVPSHWHLEVGNALLMAEWRPARTLEDAVANPVAGLRRSHRSASRAGSRARHSIPARR